MNDNPDENNRANLNQPGPSNQNTPRRQTYSGGAANLPTTPRKPRNRNPRHPDGPSDRKLRRRNTTPTSQFGSVQPTSRQRRIPLPPDFDRNFDRQSSSLSGEITEEELDQLLAREASDAENESDTDFSLGEISVPEFTETEASESDNDENSSSEEDEHHSVNSDNELLWDNFEVDFENLEMADGEVPPPQQPNNNNNHGVGNIKSMLDLAPKFYGLKDENASDFLRQFNKICAIYGYNDVERQHPVFRMCLKDGADMWATVWLEQNENPTAQQFRTAWSTEYAGEDRTRERKAQRRFDKARKSPDQSYTNFGNHLIYLRLDFVHPPEDGELIDQCIKGIDRDAAVRIRTRNPTTANELIAALKREDEISGDHEMTSNAKIAAIPKKKRTVRKRDTDDDEKKLLKLIAKAKALEKKKKTKKKGVLSITAEAGDSSSETESDNSGTSSSEEEAPKDKERKSDKKDSRTKKDIMDLKSELRKIAEQIGHVTLTTNMIKAQSDTKSILKSPDNQRNSRPRSRSQSPHRGANSANNANSRHSRNRSRSNSTLRNVINALTANNRHNDPEMQRRREQGLCYECASKNHFSRECPDKTVTRMGIERRVSYTDTNRNNGYSNSGYSEGYRNGFYDRKREQSYERRRDRRDYSNDRDRRYNRDNYQRGPSAERRPPTPHPNGESRQENK